MPLQWRNQFWSLEEGGGKLCWECGQWYYRCCPYGSLIVCQLGAAHFPQGTGKHCAKQIAGWGVVLGGLVLLSSLALWVEG